MLELSVSIALIILCCIIIWRASEGFESASEYLGRKLSAGVRGATINAIGSSMPELLTTLFFLFIFQDRDGFAGGIGTTAGSAIFNSMIIPALVILVVLISRQAQGVKVTRSVILRDGIALLICEFVLIFLLGSPSLHWTQGLVLMGMYGMYGYGLAVSMKGGVGRPEREHEVPKSDLREKEGEGLFWLKLVTLDLKGAFVPGAFSKRSAWGLLLLSLGVIALACFYLVRGCELFGEALEIRVYFVAVILASAATSVPDTFLSIRDARKGNYDDAVSNALGSNIFDICFALGFPLFLFTLIYGPIEMSATTIQDVSELRILLFILSFAAFLVYISQRRLGWFSAFTLLALYGFFTFYIISHAQSSELQPYFSQQISAWLAEINEWVDDVRFWTSQ
jgi:cation:H+ antiporter